MRVGVVAMRQFDKNKNDEIELSELRDAFRSVKEKFDQEKADVAALEQSVATLHAQIAFLQNEVSLMEAAVKAATDAAEALKA